MSQLFSTAVRRLHSFRQRRGRNARNLCQRLASAADRKCAEINNDDISFRVDGQPIIMIWNEIRQQNRDYIRELQMGLFLRLFDRYRFTDGIYFCAYFIAIRAILLLVFIYFLEKADNERDRVDIVFRRDATYLLTVELLYLYPRSSFFFSLF